MVSTVVGGMQGHDLCETIRPKISSILLVALVGGMQGHDLCETFGPIYRQSFGLHRGWRYAQS